MDLEPYVDPHELDYWRDHSHKMEYKYKEAIAIIAELEDQVAYLGHVAANPKVGVSSHQYGVKTSDLQWPVTTDPGAPASPTLSPAIKEIKPTIKIKPQEEGLKDMGHYLEQQKRINKELAKMDKAQLREAEQMLTDLLAKPKAPLTGDIDVHEVPDMIGGEPE